MVAPLPTRQLSMFPPKYPGGMESTTSASFGATPMTPKWGRIGIRTVVLFDGAVVNRDARVVDGVVNHSERIGLRRPAEIVDRLRPVSLPRCINLEDGDDLTGLGLRN